MYTIEIKPGLKVSCAEPEEALALVELIVDARKERERRERRELNRLRREATEGGKHAQS